MFGDLATFTFVHVLLSLVALAAGFVVVGGLMGGGWFRGWIGVFLVTTVLTNVTGFGFPSTQILPSHVVAVLSLVVLAVAIVAYYGQHLRGGWRRVFVITSVAALYFNVFVLIVQVLQKFPALADVAPQGSPAFGVTQLGALVLLVAMGRAAVRGTR